MDVLQIEESEFERIRYPNEALVYSVAVMSDTYFKLSHLNLSKLCLVKLAADNLIVIKEVFIWR